MKNGVVLEINTYFICKRNYYSICTNIYYSIPVHPLCVRSSVIKIQKIQIVYGNSSYI